MKFVMFTTVAGNRPIAVNRNKVLYIESANSGERHSTRIILDVAESDNDRTIEVVEDFATVHSRLNIIEGVR